MKRASAIQEEADQIATVKDLTGVFESIASTRVAKVKNKVKLSKEFFNMLWKRYSALRIDPDSRITGRKRKQEAGAKPNVFVIISAEAGLSGDIDQRLVRSMAKDYNPETTDIVVLGSHGATQLEQHDIPYVRFFQVPESDSYIDVSPVIEAVYSYPRIVVYYEEYVSLSEQNVKTIDLISSIKEMSEEAEEDVITDEETIFEPSIDYIADQMELNMMTLALSQTILESSLAQAASRFNAMALAKDTATDLLGEYKLDYHRAKRSESDRRMREILVSLKKKKRRSKGRRR